METARSMKQRLSGLMIAFSTDELGYLDDGDADAVQRFADEFATFLPRKVEDQASINIYGVDLYTEKANPAPSLERFRSKLKGLSGLAKVHGKIAAITETGNRDYRSKMIRAVRASIGSTTTSSVGSRIPRSWWLSRLILDDLEDAW